MKISVLVKKRDITRNLKDKLIDFICCINIEDMRKYNLREYIVSCMSGPVFSSKAMYSEYYIVYMLCK